MIYIYRSKPSNGAVLLADVLGGKKISKIENATRLAANPNHKVIAWGEECPNALNGNPLQNKFQDALKLREAGVETVKVYALNEPRPATGADPFVFPLEETQLTRAGAMELIQRLHLAMERTPRPAQVTYIGRRFNHVGGNDLLHPSTPQYYVEKESIQTEYRVHSFLSRSIRAGKKIPHPDVATPHEWIRSLEGGWRISYDGVSVKQRHRDLAHRAVAALGLSFGAVDIAERPDGSLFVLEVNRAPGLDGNTIDIYADAIERWSRGEMANERDIDEAE